VFRYITGYARACGEYLQIAQHTASIHLAASSRPSAGGARVDDDPLLMQIIKLFVPAARDGATLRHLTPRCETRHCKSFKGYRDSKLFIRLLNRLQHGKFALAAEITVQST